MTVGKDPEGVGAMARAKVAAIRVPVDLLREVDERVGAGQRSRFFIDAVRRELSRLEQVEALEGSGGSWNRRDHPDLPDTVDGLRDMLRTGREKGSRLS